MGMGDKPAKYVPKRNTIRDDVIGKEFAACCVRSCPEPHVIERFGIGGVANVSIYTCKRCKHRIEYKLHFGLGCGYELEKSVQPGTET